MTRDTTHYFVHNLINQMMIILETCVIWSFFRLDIGTRISFLNKFYWSTSSSVDYQWYEIMEDND